MTGDGLCPRWPAKPAWSESATRLPFPVALRQSPHHAALTLMKVIGHYQACLGARLAAGVMVFLLSSRVAAPCFADEATAAAHFHERVAPILETYCYACHGYGEHKGGHAFD